MCLQSPIFMTVEINLMKYKFFGKFAVKSDFFQYKLQITVGCNAYCQNLNKNNLNRNQTILTTYLTLQLWTLYKLNMLTFEYKDIQIKLIKEVPNK